MNADRPSDDPEVPTGSVFGKLPDSRPGSRSPLRDPARKPKRRARSEPRDEAQPDPGDPAPRSSTPEAGDPGADPSPPPRSEPEPASAEQGGGLEDLAWAGVAAAAEAATLGVRLASRAMDALRESVDRRVIDRYLRAFWERAYRENVTGLAAMVAYNLALALFPFALLVLFIFGQVIQNPDVEASVLRDLESIFPAVEQDSLTSVLDRIRSSSTTIGLVAAIGAVWIGASFWGAMDTAFCRIYHVECRGWVEQKRFALLMLLVVIAFLAASVIVPVAEGVLASSAEDLPFGLDEVGVLRAAVVLLAALLVTFGICALIYYVVPKGHVPWRAVWPGAMFVTATMAIANAVFPVYLTQSNIDQLGGALGLILVALVWFYIVSLALLSGAVINALRYELHDTGGVEEVRARAFAAELDDQTQESDAGPERQP